MMTNQRLTTYLTAFIVALMFCGAPAAMAQRNNLILNRPYADMRAWHMGFSIGMHTESLQLTHNGHIDPATGEQWWIEQPDFSPGFCVTGLLDLRLHTHLNLRLTPGMYFGNRNMVMREWNSGQIVRQNLKSNLVVLPAEFKISSLRHYNVRPYLLAGGMMTVDVSKRHPRDPLQLNPVDVLLTLGAGTDIYLPYFKLCPEVKYCFGMTDQIRHNRPDMADDPTGLKYTQSLTKAATHMVVVSFFFE